MSGTRFGLLDLEDDPFFGATMQSMQSIQRMNNMMTSMFDPFGMMGGPAAIMGNQQMANHQQRQLQMPGMQMMPFGFPPMGMNMNRMFSDLQNMSGNPNCHSFTSSSVMTMTTGPDGRPQVYQESMSSRTGPEGIRETKKSVSDSRTGTRKLAIGHHIGERAHIVEREKNEYTGDQEERQDFINLDEEEAETFNREWETKSRRSVPAVGYAPHNGPYDRVQVNRPLALPSTVPSDQQNNSHSRILATPRRAIRDTHSSKKNYNKSKNKDSSRSVESTSTSNSASASATSSSSLSSSATKATTVNHQQSSESPQDLSSSSSRNNNNNSSNYNSNNTSRKREHSPEIEEIENPNQKRRSHGTTSDDDDN